MIYIAIDPGLTVSIAAIDDDAQLILCADLPVIRDNKLAWIDANGLTGLLMQCRDGRPARITVERSQSMPGQGVSSTFTTGVVMGSILAACQNVSPCRCRSSPRPSGSVLWGSIRANRHRSIRPGSSSRLPNWHASRITIGRKPAYWPNTVAARLPPARRPHDFTSPLVHRSSRRSEDTWALRLQYR